jgi:hypothetical protein
VGHGQSPHYDVVYIPAESLDALADAVIIATPCTTVINPYYDPEGSPDR